MLHKGLLVMLRLMTAALLTVSVLGAVCTHVVQSGDAEPVLQQGLSTQTENATQEMG